MRLPFSKKSLVQCLCLLSILFIQTSCSDSDEDCTTVSSTLTASIEVSSSAICTGESAEITFTGTPGSTISYNDGSTTSSIVLDATGSAVQMISPSEATTYTLENITLNGCEKVLSNSALIEIGGPDITENLVGNWAVTNVDQSNGKTVTFLADGTGTAPEDGSFTMYSSLLQQFSDGFTWEYNTLTDRMVIEYNLAFGYPVNYEVDLNDCDDIILRDVTHVAEPQYTFTLARQ